MPQHTGAIDAVAFLTFNGAWRATTKPRFISRTVEMRIGKGARCSDAVFAIVPLPTRPDAFLNPSPQEASGPVWGASFDPPPATRLPAWRARTQHPRFHDVAPPKSCHVAAPNLRAFAKRLGTDVPFRPAPALKSFCASRSLATHTASQNNDRLASKMHCSVANVMWINL